MNNVYKVHNVDLLIPETINVFHAQIKVIMNGKNDFRYEQRILAAEHESIDCRYNQRVQCTL
jgi:hypothetical protein